MKLKAYLQATGMTQAQFGNLLGASQPAVNAWVFGYRTPRPAMIKKIIRTTNGAIKADDFLPDDQAEAA